MLYYIAIHFLDSFFGMEQNIFLTFTIYYVLGIHLQMYIEMNVESLLMPASPLLIVDDADNH